MTAPVQPQTPDQVDARRQELEARKKALLRQREIAKGLYMGTDPKVISSEHQKRIEANQTVLDAVQKELDGLNSAQAKMRRRQGTLAELEAEASH